MVSTSRVAGIVVVHKKGRGGNEGTGGTGIKVFSSSEESAAADDESRSIEEAPLLDSRCCGIARSKKTAESLEENVIASIAGTTTSALITMPAPPPYGLSST